MDGRITAVQAVTTQFRIEALAAQSKKLCGRFAIAAGEIEGGFDIMLLD